MPVVAKTVIWLICSNIFMTFAWYAHLRNLSQKPWITLSVFVPFAALYMKEPVRLNYLWAAVCMCGAVYFMFRR